MSHPDSDDFTKIVAAGAQRANVLRKFAETDRAALAKMPDKELAEWQSEFGPESPQVILAEHEWQRRLTAEQVGATKFAAWLSIAGVVIGVFLGFGLSLLSTSLADEKAKKANQSESSSNSNAQIQRPEEKPEGSPPVGVVLQQPPHTNKSE